MKQDQNSAYYIKSIRDLKSPFSRLLAKTYNVKSWQILPRYSRFKEEFDSRKYFQKSKDLADNVDYYLNVAACWFIVNIEIVEHSNPICFPIQKNMRYIRNKKTDDEMLIEATSFQGVAGKGLKKNYIIGAMGVLQLMLKIEMEYKKSDNNHMLLKKVIKNYKKTYVEYLEELK